MSSDHSPTILQVLKDLSHELRDLDLGESVPAIDSISSLNFLRDYVSSNKPVIIRNATSHWPAHQLWTEPYLVEKAGDGLVTVALTPDGRADAVSFTTPAAAGERQVPCFALPYQHKMPLHEFFDLARQCNAREAAQVPYMQFQNSSLTAELPQLLKDVDAHLPWATEAFGCLPDAVNIWMGTKHSVTTWHRDHYQNIYCMVSGSKTFHLLPPTDAYRMALKTYPLASWKPQRNHRKVKEQEQLEEFVLELHEPEAKVLWSSIQPLPSKYTRLAEHQQTELYGKKAASESITTKQPQNSNRPTTLSSTPANKTNLSSNLYSSNNDDNNNENNKGNLVWDDAGLPPPFTVTIQAGQALYLPACWWHEVHQSPPHSSIDNSSKEDEEESGGGGPCADVAVAVNYWYDMAFDCKYAFAKASEGLAVAAGLNESL